MQVPQTTEPRRSRRAVASIFALNGFLAAMWVAHIPVISDRTGVGHDELGGLLLLLGGSAFVGMQVCGPLIDRWGSRPLTVAAAVVLAAVIVTPVLAVDTLTLGAALAAFGFANGCLDVSMNAQAVAVERAYRRPIMSSFHGWFSSGSLVGSGVVAATLWADVGVVPTVACAAVAGLVVVAAVARGLAGRDERPTTSTNNSSGSSSGSTWWDGIDRRRLVLLAIVAFGLMLAEGTAYDWSALHVVESYGTGEAIGAIAFGAFSATMTVSRFVIDPVVASVGAVRVVRVGALVGIVGMAIAIVSPVPALAVVGWAVFGVGLAGLIPQIFTAAGNLTDSAGGRTISIVVGCGYLGMLAGPAVVGFISSRTSLNTGLLAALAALLLAVCLAGVVRPPQRPVSALGEPRSSHPGGRATLEG
ncbi:MFS transporter [Gordonia amicalis]|uniref:MFS transporter n=1 Tax=Gordonia amicalis TaxID=89053 RepID=A0AAE4R670_9ACTN|nr:MFS transporter [Gordonia amicalis]MBA5845843.1 MFS transporter [Gordonia amicalis]MDV6313251.1 MFS transporter [Gordonia amicalis]UKO89897.1 MFS transporter [Gordonia amicalis]UOG21624.1 MFS transporter [Gordonia amicalis]